MSPPVDAASLNLFGSLLTDELAKYELTDYVDWVSVRAPGRKRRRVIRYGGTARATGLRRKAVEKRVGLDGPDQFLRFDTWREMEDTIPVSWYPDYHPLIEMTTGRAILASAVCLGIHESLERAACQSVAPDGPTVDSSYYTTTNRTAKRCLEYTLDEQEEIRAHPLWPHDKPGSNRPEVRLQLSWMDFDFDPGVCF